jgi:hypothetical protein
MRRDECLCFCRSLIVNGQTENGDFDEFNSGRFFSLAIIKLFPRKNSLNRVEKMEFE